MIYVIVGILCGFIVCGIMAEVTYSHFSYCLKVEGIGISLLFGLILTFAFSSIGISFGWTDAGYNTCSENYTLKKVHENQYYVTNTDGNSISVWIMDGDSWEKVSFPENRVKFQSTTGEANVQIETKKLQEPSDAEKFWFLKGVMIKQLKEIYKSVVISVPEGSEVTELPNIEAENTDKKQNVQEDEKNLYCTECGAKLDTGNKFCGGCGIKLQ